MSLWFHPCFACERDAFIPVRSGTIVDPASDAAPYFGSARRVTGYFDIVRCTGCGLCQMRPCDDEVALAGAYAALETPEPATLDGAAVRLARSQARFLTRHRAAPGRLLDVGCGPGHFLAAAAERGFQTEGFDPSPDCVALARARVPAASVAESDIEHAELPDGSLDVVSALDVFEHLPRLRTALARVRAWLKPGGHLLLQVPDIGSPAARLLGARWPLLLREHISYFDRVSLAHLLAETGFELVVAKACLRYFSAANLARRLREFGIPRVPEFGRGWFAAPVGELRALAVKR